MVGKRVGFSFLVLTLVLSFVSIVSAASLENSLNNFVDSAEPIFRALLGDVSGVGAFSSSEVLFAKFLVFILVLSIVNVSLSQFPTRFTENKKLTLLIATIVALLAVRFLVEGQLIALIWLPYGVLGVLLSSLLPLIIVFFFLNSFNSRLIRRVGWALFGVIFLVLGYLRWGDFSTSSGAFGFNLAWIYILTGAVSWIMYLFDKEIYASVDFARIHAMTDSHKKEAAIRLGGEIQELQARLAGSLDASTRHTIERLIKEKKKTLRSLMSS